MSLVTDVPLLTMLNCQTDCRVKCIELRTLQVVLATRLYQQFSL
jgi:hypothetical protein